MAVSTKKKEIKNLESNQLVKIAIANDNYSKVLEGVEIFITKHLSESLKRIPSKNADNVFESLKNRGFQGGKHLIEKLKDKLGAKLSIVLTDGESKISGNKVQINYDEYRKYGGNKFFSVYRQTGLETASGYLSSQFSDIFRADSLPTKKSVKQVIKSLPNIAKELPKKSQNQLLQKVANILNDDDIKDPEILLEIRAAANQALYRKELGIFKERLLKNFSESSWQKWIYRNKWIFGNNYAEVIEKKRVGLGQIPDYLFLTTDGFLDVLEIKLPEKPVMVNDKSHAGSYYWSLEVTKTIGQIVNYLQEMEFHRAKLERELDVLVVKPRGFILVGKSSNWKAEQNEAFRNLTSALHGIKILTYDHLFKRGEKLLQMFDS